MSNIYISDKEQVEMMKNWWRENGKFLLGSIAAVLLLSAGWRYWQNYKFKDAAIASSVYEQMLNHESNQDYTAVESDVTELQTNHAKTPYAALGALVAAQNAVNSNKMDLALKKLNWVIHNSKNKDFKQIASMRLARVLLGMKKYDDALLSLSDIEAKAYLPLIQELRGDILLAKGDENGARIAYQTALHSLRASAPNRTLLQIKANQVGQTD